MSFLPSPSIRKVLAVPTQDKVDFRAACFCHKNIVDIGFVCSVCLSSTSYMHLSPCFLHLHLRFHQFSVSLSLSVQRVGKLLSNRSRDLTDIPISTKFPIKALQRLQSSRPSVAPQKANSTAQMGLPSTSSIRVPNGAASTSTNGGASYPMAP